MEIRKNRVDNTSGKKAKSLNDGRGVGNLPQRGRRESDGSQCVVERWQWRSRWSPRDGWKDCFVTARCRMKKMVRRWKPLRSRRIEKSRGSQLMIILAPRSAL